MITRCETPILHSRSIIEKAPLQVYASAVVFSPKMSLFKRPFTSQGPSWISVGQISTKTGVCLHNYPKAAENLLVAGAVLAREHISARHYAFMEDKAYGVEGMFVKREESNSDATRLTIRPAQLLPA
jgi:hypothetical protein